MSYGRKDDPNRCRFQTRNISTSVLTEVGEKTTPTGAASKQTHRQNDSWINRLEVIMRRPAEMSVVDGS